MRFPKSQNYDKRLLHIQDATGKKKLTPGRSGNVMVSPENILFTHFQNSYALCQCDGGRSRRIIIMPSAFVSGKPKKQLGWPNLPHFQFRKDIILYCCYIAQLKMSLGPRQFSKYRGGCVNLQNWRVFLPFEKNTNEAYFTALHWE